MENRIKKSGGVENPKRKSLDLKGLYNSRVSDVGHSKNQVYVENHREDVKRRKRKRGKEVSLSCIESDAKETKECINGTEPDQDFIQQSSDGSKLFQGISFALEKNGKTINIPKRPRGLVGRKRLKSGKVSQSLNISHSEDHVEIPKTDSNKVINPDDRVVKFESGDTSSSDLQPKQKLETQSVGNVSSSSSKLRHKVATEKVKKRRYDRPNSVNHVENEDTRVIKNGDMCSKISRRIRRKQKALVVDGDGGKSLKKKSRRSNGSSESDSRFVSFIDDEDEENLEQNAARMLSSRFDPNCTGFSPTINGFPSPVSPVQDSFVPRDNSFGTMESASTDDKSRALRPRSEDKGKGIPRKRRHFYEVLPDDLDACWFLNRKIKIFWPLDESWYYGVVNDYHPECKLYHIKYDDRDEEWVDLHEEKFKLLLLPSEVPGRTKPKLSGNKDVSNGNVPSSNDDGRIENHLDSETIASWLARTSRHIKSLPKFLEKRKASQAHLPLGYRSSSEETDKSKGKLVDSKISLNEPECKSASVDKLLDLGSFDRSPVLQHVKSSLPCQKIDSVNKFSCAKRARSDPKCESASADKIHIHGKLDQTSMITSSGSENVLNIVYVRRKYGGLFKTYSSLFTPVKSHDSSEEIVAVDPDTVGPVTVSLNDRKEDNSPYGCLESDGRVCLTDSKDELGLYVLMASQEISVPVCLHLLPFLEYLHGRWNFLLLHKMLILHHGSVVATSPAVILEMLFMKSNVGLRFLLFEGCLKQALAIVCLILTEFSQSDKKSNWDMQLPMTSIRIKLSSVRDRCKKRSFSFYIFSRFQSSKWIYLESKLIQYCRLVNQLPISGCFVCNIKEFELGNSQKCKHRAGSEIFSLEVGEYILLRPSLVNARDITTEENTQTVEAETPTLRSLPGCEQDLGTKCVLASNFIEKVHYSTNLEKTNLDGKENIPQVTAQSYLSEFNKEMHGQCLVSSFSSLPAAIKSPASNPKFDSGTISMTVGIPSSDQVGIPFNGTREISNQTSYVDCSIIDEFDHSPNLTCSMSSWKQRRINSVSSPSGDYSCMLPDGKTNFMRNGFSNGPKKPRTQVQYTLPFAGYDLNSRQKVENYRAPHCKRIRRASQRRMPDSYKNNPKNLELLACDANILITNGDKGWRESGAHVFLEVADHNEWRLVVKLSGIIRYSYKVKHILQPGSTNRFSHAMMWRGGNDWVLEFPDRSQWTLFKEMHEECYNRNIRAASVKHIPIPGVWLVEERNEYGTEVPFARNSAKYFRQVQTDVEMALDPSHVLYDLDSEDEQWLMENRTCTEKHLCDEISDESMEKIIDAFEKISYAKHMDNFTDAEIEELVNGIGSLATTKAIYKYWQHKREKKGMHLTRHLQPPLWDRYQQQLKGWELSVAKGNSSFSVPPHEKPPMFAFCLKPRGLDVPNKGSKQRSHRKFSVSGHHHTTSGDQDSHFAFGRRSNGHEFGDEKLLYANSVHESSDASPSHQASMRALSPRDTYFSLITNVSEWNCYPKVFKYKPTKLGSHSPFPFNNQQMMSYKHRTVANRNGIPQWNMDLPKLSGQRFNYFEVPHRQVVERSDGSVLQEFRLRDASRAAQHALKIAKIKREKAQRLFSNAEFAIHKAVVALMTAEAIKTAVEHSDGNN